MLSASSQRVMRFRLASGIPAPAIISRTGRAPSASLCPGSLRYATSSASTVRPSRSSSTALTIVVTAVATLAASYLWQGQPSSSIVAGCEGNTAGFPDSSIGIAAVAEEVHNSPKTVKYASQEVRQQVIQLLRDKLGDKVSVEKEDRVGHGTAGGGTHHALAVPDCIVYVESTEDVVEVIKLANQYRMPVVPYSGGTALEGHCTAPYGGICLDLSRMDKIHIIREKDSDAVCGPGVVWDELNAELVDRGLSLFFPLDPAPGATLGGMLNTGCSGTNAVRYGTARGEWFLNATIVLADGQVIKTRQRSRKSSAGFDLTKLFVGSEGTLGIVTELTVRLAPLLPTTVAVCGFPDVEKAVEAVGEIINKGIPIQCVELCDSLMMNALNRFGDIPTPLPETDSIFFKFQGNPKAMEEAQELVRDIAKQYGGHGMVFAKDKDEANALWAARKMAHWAILALVDGGKVYSTDICVPVSNLPRLVREIQQDLKDHNLIGPMLGHVGDGNVHCGLVFRPEDFPQADAAAHRMVERAIALDGTCTGEHGVGLGKREYLESELGTGTVQMMKRIKTLMDPNWILNPGKLYPDTP